MKKTIYLLSIVLFTPGCKQKTSIEPNVNASAQNVINCNVPSVISYKLNVKSVINQHCTACHNDDTAIPLNYYESLLPYCAEEKLITYLNEDAYHQNIEYSVLDSCERKIIITWIKQGFKNN